MAKKMRNMLVMAAVQTAKGTPATLAAGANAILVRSAMPTVIKGDFVKRPLIRGALGNYGSDISNEHRVLELEVELAGSGAAGTRPGQAPLLIGCRMAETVTPGVSAAYQPVSSGEQYLTMTCDLDGLMFRMVDALGTVSFELSPGGYPVAKYTFIGVYEPITDRELPTGALFSAQLKPLLVSRVNTPVFTLDGISFCTSAFSMDVANEISYRDMINCSGVDIGDRNPTASFTFELGTAAQRNWGETARQGTEMPLALTHGVTAGNIVQLAGPKLSINSEPTISDDRGTAFVTIGCDVKPNLGNDEFVITFR